MGDFTPKINERYYWVEKNCIFHAIWKDTLKDTERYLKYPMFKNEDEASYYLYS